MELVQTILFEDGTCFTSENAIEILEESEKRWVEKYIGLWTGLKDDNGTFIRVGDIVECKQYESPKDKENQNHWAVDNFMVMLGNTSECGYKWGFYLINLADKKRTTDILSWCGMDGQDDLLSCKKTGEQKL